MLTMNSIDEARERGRRARAAGASLSANPCARETLRRAWIDGWYEYSAYLERISKQYDETPGSIVGRDWTPEGR
jgi:ribosome modulation factor